jgi:acetoin utilization deacetylase AcuC-like enzyme
METQTMSETGYLFEEAYMWHDPGNQAITKWVEPTEHWENPHTKRRMHNLVIISGLYDRLIKIRARKASEAEITRFHTKEYHDRIKYESENCLRGSDAGELVPFAYGAYEIAALSAGGVMAGVEAVVEGKVRNAYCLVRPPGHHAEADLGRGFCIFNNIALAAMHAKTLTLPTGKHIEKIAIVDYDVHHGNGTQKAFWNDPNTLFVSIHQDNNYPANSGAIDEIGSSIIYPVS